MPRLIRQNAPVADSLRQHDLVQVQRVLLSPVTRTPLSQRKAGSRGRKSQAARDNSARQDRAPRLRRR
jgi:hypothetical protein